jgi:hypothetical protein
MSSGTTLALASRVTGTISATTLSLTPRISGPASRRVPSLPIRTVLHHSTTAVRRRIRHYRRVLSAALSWFLLCPEPGLTVAVKPLFDFHQSTRLEASASLPVAFLCLCCLCLAHLQVLMSLWVWRIRVLLLNTQTTRRCSTVRICKICSSHWCLLVCHGVLLSRACLVKASALNPTCINAQSHF